MPAWLALQQNWKALTQHNFKLSCFIGHLVKANCKGLIKQPKKHDVLHGVPWSYLVIKGRVIHSPRMEKSMLRHGMKMWGYMLICQSQYSVVMKIKGKWVLAKFKSLTTSSIHVSFRCWWGIKLKLIWSPTHLPNLSLAVGWCDIFVICGWLCWK